MVTKVGGGTGDGGNSSKKSSKNKTKDDDQQKWNTDLKRQFLDLYIQEKATPEGKNADGSSLKAKSYNKIVVALNTKNNTKFTKSQLTSYFSAFKRIYTAFTALKANSGIGISSNGEKNWDREADVPTCSDAEWDALIAAKKQKDRSMLNGFLKKPPAFLALGNTLFWAILPLERIWILACHEFTISTMTYNSYEYKILREG